MDDRSFHVLLEIKEELGELRSDVRSMSEVLTKHISDDERTDSDIEKRVEEIERSNFRLSATKAILFSAAGIAWTLATWVWAARQALAK